MRNISSRQNPSYISFLKPPKSPPPTTNEIEISAEERTRRDMDLSDIATKLGFSESKPLLLRKAQELRRLCDVHFDSSIIGIGEVCKGIICLEIAATRMQVLFDRQNAIKLSGMSEKAYNRSFNALQNSLGVQTKLDIRELGIQFGCVRLIPSVQKGLSLYKDRYLAALPVSRRAVADFNRPVFTAVAFYLCVKKKKGNLLKVDKFKLIELCGTSESEFTSVSTTMKDLCFDVFGTAKEKKDLRAVKGNRGNMKKLVMSLMTLPLMMKMGWSFPPTRDKRMEKCAYEVWKSSVLASNDQREAKVPDKRMKQARLNFAKNVPKKVVLEAS
ncbi:origin of replication complex subunit 6 [Cinnamomum micranthum f. kanehirae]|uniref:Origin of replication complex subunit 6 n=1 Tax=Cinnamomum micranthum f. kanehirae TaxID=337451 RepID=A0A3S3PP90_9MAGN|nr:origin of replication complex subunit 6 [Cinnamomum micranthum f. kanehirae]